MPMLRISNLKIEKSIRNNLKEKDRNKETPPLGISKDLGPSTKEWNNLKPNRQNSLRSKRS